MPQLRRGRHPPLRRSDSGSADELLMVGTVRLRSPYWRKTYEKMELAIQAAPFMTKELLATRFDLEKEVNAIIDKIAAWNS